MVKLVIMLVILSDTKENPFLESKKYAYQYMKSYNCWVLKFYFCRRRGKSKQERGTQSHQLIKQAMYRPEIDNRMNRYTIQTFFKFQVKFRHFINYVYTETLQFNLLTKLRLKLSRKQQLNQKYNTDWKKDFFQRQGQ